jgi:hypothetical protein
VSLLEVSHLSEAVAELHEFGADFVVVTLESRQIYQPAYGRDVLSQLASFQMFQSFQSFQSS